MDRPTSLNSAPNGLSNIKGMSLAEPGATGQAFSRMVTEFEQPVTNHHITDQSISSNNQGYLNPEKEWLKGFAVQNQTSHKDSPAIPLAIPINTIEPLENHQAAEYDPENNTFSIYSLTKGIQSTSQNSTDVDIKLNPPIQIPDQDGIGNSSNSTAPIAIITRRLKNEHLQQYTSPAIQAEEAIDENSSHIECQRELRKDPAYAQPKRKLQRNRYQTDPAYAKRLRERLRERKRELRKDPAYAQRERERQRERRKDPVYAQRQRELQRERYRTDPAYAERQRELQRERYRTDPAYAERQRESKRELRKDPAYAQRQRERKRELRKDPAYAQRERERKRERERERYQTDPAYAERKRERTRELRKDPAYLKRERERKKQYRQSVNSAKNQGNLTLTSNLTETTQSSSKNSEGTAPPLFSRQAEGIFTVPIDPSPVSRPLA